LLEGRICYRAFWQQLSYRDVPTFGAAFDGLLLDVLCGQLGDWYRRLFVLVGLEGLWDFGLSDGQDGVSDGLFGGLVGQWAQVNGR